MKRIVDLNITISIYFLKYTSNQGLIVKKMMLKINENKMLVAKSYF